MIPAVTIFLKDKNNFQTQTQPIIQHNHGLSPDSSSLKIYETDSLVEVLCLLTSGREGRL